jgi:hypothetical protein
VLKTRRRNKREHPKAEGDPGKRLTNVATALLDATTSLRIAWVLLLQEKSKIQEVFSLEHAILIE